MWQVFLQLGPTAPPCTKQEREQFTTFHSFSTNKKKFTLESFRNAFKYLKKSEKTTLVMATEATAANNTDLFKSLSRARTHTRARTHIINQDHKKKLQPQLICEQMSS